MTNLKHNYFLYIYFNSLHVSSNTVLIIRRINCINTTSGKCHSVLVTVSCAGRKGTLCRLFQFTFMLIQQWVICFILHVLLYLSYLHTKQSPKQSDIYQGLYWYNWFSWWWARGCSKHVENWSKYIENNCASIWSLTKNHWQMFIHLRPATHPAITAVTFAIKVRGPTIYGASGYNFFVAQKPIWGIGHLIVEDSISHTHTHIR